MENMFHFVNPAELNELRERESTLRKEVLERESTFRNNNYDQEVGDVEMDVQVENEVLNESLDLRADEVLRNVTEEGLQQLLQIKSKAIVESQIEKDTCTDFLRLTLENVHYKMVNLDRKHNSLRERNVQIEGEETVESANLIHLETVASNTKSMFENMEKTCKQDECQENQLKETTKMLKDVYTEQRNTYFGILENERNLEVVDKQIHQLKYSSIENKRQYENYRVERENMLTEKSMEYDKHNLSYDKMQSDYGTLQNFSTDLKSKIAKGKIEFSERETQVDKIQQEIKDAQTFSISKQEEMNQALIVLKEQCDCEFKRLESLGTAKSELAQEVKRHESKNIETKMKIDKLQLDHTILLNKVNDLNKKLEMENINKEEIIKKCDNNLQLKKQIEEANSKYENLMTSQASLLQEKTIQQNLIETINNDIARINNNKSELLLDVENITDNLKKSSELEMNLLLREKQIHSAFNCCKYKLNLKNAEYEINCKELEMKRKESAFASSKFNNSNLLKKENLKNKFNSLRFSAEINLEEMKSKYQKEKNDLLEELELTSSQIQSDEIEIKRLDINLNDKILTNEELVDAHKKLDAKFAVSQSLKPGILKPDGAFTIPGTSKNVTFKPTISWDSYSDSFESLREELLKSSGSEDVDLKSPPTRLPKRQKLHHSPPEKDN